VVVIGFGDGSLWGGTREILVVEGMGEQGFWRERSYGDVPLGLDVGYCFLSLRDPGNELPGLPNTKKTAKRNTIMAVDLYPTSWMSSLL
jgi:hypothetical protein